MPSKPDQSQYNKAQSSQDTKWDDKNWESPETNTAGSVQRSGYQETHNKSKNYNTQYLNSEKSRGRGRNVTFNRTQNTRDPKENFTESERYSGNQGSGSKFFSNKPWEHSKDSGTHSMQTRSSQKRGDSNLESERRSENQNRPNRSSSLFKKDDRHFSRDESNRNRNASKQYDSWNDTTFQSEGNTFDWNATDSEVTDFEDKKLTKNECDEEYEKFCEQLKKHKIKEFQKVEEEQSDLFEMPLDFCLAHCVAEDMNMGSGIAVTFR